MVRHIFLTGFVIVGVLLQHAVALEPGRDFFEKKIRPILVGRCYKCHSRAAADPKGGLLLDSRAGMRQGGDSGPAVVPRDVPGSKIIAALRHETVQMPPDAKLPPHITQDFVTWIEMGAPDPRDQADDSKTENEQTWEQIYQSRRDWWSLRLVTRPGLPRGKQQWSQHPVDRFIHESLRQQQLQPCPQADRATLIRRLAFALTGLPPTAEEYRGFVDDQSDHAWKTLVDYYLQSPHYGERFARHWMDVVRYTDSHGYEWDIPAKGAWRYRDYLIRAFNQDVAFDQLVREQIAGDLLKHPRFNEELQINESVIGPMFYQMGEKRHGDSSQFEGVHQEMLDNKIDALSKAFQATTVACARCHDHKLDAISQKEYYALAGVMMSSRWTTNTLDLPSRNMDLIEQLQKLKPQVRAATARAWLADIDQVSAAALTKLVPEDNLPHEDLNFVWQQLTRVPTEEIASRWEELRDLLLADSAERTAKNRSACSILVDFNEELPAGWTVDGVGTRQKVQTGDFQIDQVGGKVIQTFYLGGIATGAISTKLNGAVRSPLFQNMPAPFFSVRMAGGQYAAWRTPIDNAFLCNTEKRLTNSQYQWELFPTRTDRFRERRVFLEFVTKESNPNFPSIYSRLIPLEDEEDPRSWFAINQIVAHQTEEAPREEITRYAELFDAPPPANIQQALERYRRWIKAAMTRWENSQSTEQDVLLLNQLLLTPWITNNKDDVRLKSLVEQYRQLEAKVQASQAVNGMVDADEGLDYRVNIRGDVHTLGEQVPRGYLRVLSKGTGPFKDSGSGRLELAEHIASSANPLTARVFVNRIWHWLFGRGIVATPSDFGHLGEQPSHPELLDWLTSEFIRSGWSTRKLVRLIVTSQTWQQSGQVKQKGFEKDPENQMLHHFPTQRLDAESIRDAMLAVSGRLDRSLYGPTSDPHRNNEDMTKRLFSGPLDGNGRRSIYTKVTILEQCKFMSLFNQPQPKIPSGRRDVTTTPAQSLALLNHRFVVGQAEHWGQQLVHQEDSTIPSRLKDMLFLAYSRSMQPQELDRWTEVVGKLSELHGESNRILYNHDVWTDVAHTIFNTKEFIYIR